MTYPSCSSEYEKYFQSLDKAMKNAYDYAEMCRKKNLDPHDYVEIKIAKDVASRVEGIVGPKGIAELITKEIEKGQSRGVVAYKIVSMIASGQVIQGTDEELIEQAVRTGVSILTDGVLVAPTEGISKVKITTDKNGDKYVSIFFAGPIRSAGGTVAAQSVVLADVARKIRNIPRYHARDEEIERYVEEIDIYDRRCAHLQYRPSDDHIRHIVKNCPVCIDGDRTHKDEEVAINKNLERVHTNGIRGGVALVICEGIAQKAAKVYKYTKNIGLGWDWLQGVLKINISGKEPVKIKPNQSIIKGSAGGRPILAYPMAKGGFRIRYGRSRTNGIMSKNMHVALLPILDQYIVFGTQMKVERPGKATVGTFSENLEPPVVLLNSGRVLKVDSYELALAIKSQIKEILFLGDLLTAFGDFLKSNHPLVPSGFVEEWWEQILKSKSLNLKIDHKSISLNQALDISINNNIPLHPKFLFSYSDLSFNEIIYLLEYLKSCEINIKTTELAIEKQATDFTKSKIKSIFEKLLMPHDFKQGKLIFDSEDFAALCFSFGLIKKQDVNNLSNGFSIQIPENRLSVAINKIKSINQFSDNAIKELYNTLSSLAGVEIKVKIPLYVGARMGRPEKAKERTMKNNGKINGLFPMSHEFKTKSITKAAETKKRSQFNQYVIVDTADFYCPSCKKSSLYRLCDACGSICDLIYHCPKCKKTFSESNSKELKFKCPACNIPLIAYSQKKLILHKELNRAKQRVQIFSDLDVKAVKGMVSDTKIPERMEKLILRAKHDVYVYKDGTIRFDATDVPLTHFTPKEIGTSIEKLKELGYLTDYLGNELTSEDQLIELRTQDILLNIRGAEYFLRVSQYIDDLLVHLYGVEPFYRFTKIEDLIGAHFIAISPHTSAGVLCRVIGFTKSHVGYQHPYLHNAKRRNADGDEDGLILLLDALLNFSKEFIGSSRGGTMDTPIVVSTILDPIEVDDEVHNMEIVKEYPLQFYQDTEKLKMPGEIKYIKIIKDVLGTPAQYQGFHITHHTSFIELGDVSSKYTQIKEMVDKLKNQAELQAKIRAVDTQDAIMKVILNHFIPDIYGNLISFSRQKFRCVDCNASYRRVPLHGKCINMVYKNGRKQRCNGKLILTINRGGIEKYLHISIDFAKRYNLPHYLQQRLEYVKRDITSIFDDDKKKQLSISDFF